jgi:hypothetical protein
LPSLLPRGGTVCCTCDVTNVGALPCKGLDAGVVCHAVVCHAGVCHAVVCHAGVSS